MTSLTRDILGDADSAESGRDTPTAASVTHESVDDELALAESRMYALCPEGHSQLAIAIHDFVKLHELRSRLVDNGIRGRLAVLGRIEDALRNLRQIPNADEMIAVAPRYLCEACDFDRAVLYRVQGTELLAESVWVQGDPDAAARLLASARANPAGLNRSYAAAPIMPEGRVIGFIHADHQLKSRRVDEFDREILRAFAAGFGMAVERAQLADRLRAQGREIGELLRQTEAVLAEHLDAGVELVNRDSDEICSPRTIRAAQPRVENILARELTRRELQVLALLGGGASNAEIATRLCISTDTAKSHVRQIFRKLGATNRVEAATIWLRARHRRPLDMAEALRTG